MHLVDSHCHITQEYPKNNPTACTNNDIISCFIMMTNPSDYDKIINLPSNTDKDGGRIFSKCFGIHPWYSHYFTLTKNISKISHYTNILTPVAPKNTQNTLIKLFSEKFIQSLPDPIYLCDYITNHFYKDNIQWHLIGEIGLDKVFTCKNLDIHTPGSNIKFKVKITHQQNIFLKFVELAWQNSLPISIHSVKTHGLLYNLLVDFMKDKINSTDYNGNKKLLKIILHSYTGSKDLLHMWLRNKAHIKVYFGISQYININKKNDIIKYIPIDNLLIETDLSVSKLSYDEQRVMLIDTLKYVSSGKMTVDEYNDKILMNVYSDILLPN
ncbi:putative endodeoxyribonuclease SCDLUD_001244 [Saccharomycodes ludwigii]|uniref:putative endodeoxyribonuclease n=1 Tax=Saccharomycodes ludwigii TaxID=36035 RepID=UPI001E83629F|nr:hypothetical protein SCDLUD_001244 [Saccharomycodes ludwigii]KAH3903600.1 hypothetical protein SCDLUD_001244 [Saccharomycodes ludwigii]